MTEYAYAAIEMKFSEENNEEMVYGAFKLFSLTMANEAFSYDKKRIFHALIFKIFNDFNKEIPTKARNKNKKIVYDIIKKLMFADPSLF